MQFDVNPKVMKQAQDVLKGRGFFGWLTRIFMGRRFMAGMAQGAQMLEAVQARQQVRQDLLGSGTPASAKVLAIQDTGTLVNFDPVVLLTVQVSPEGEPPFQAAFTTPVPKIAIPRVGDTVSLRYDPRDRSRIALAS
jgi:hypothetical protein